MVLPMGIGYLEQLFDTDGSKDGDRVALTAVFYTNGSKDGDREALTDVLY